MYFTGLDTYTYAVNNSNINCTAPAATCRDSIHTVPFKKPRHILGCTEWWTSVNDNSIGTAPLVEATRGRLVLTTEGTQGDPAAVYTITLAGAKRTDTTNRAMFAVNGTVLTDAALIEGSHQLFFGSDDHFLYSVNMLPTPAELIWRFDAGAPVASAPVTDGTVVVFAAVCHAHTEAAPVPATHSHPDCRAHGVTHQGKTVYCLLANDGSVQWTAETSGQVLARTAINKHGMVLAADLEGNVYGIGGACARCVGVHPTVDPVSNSTRRVLTLQARRCWPCAS